MRTEFTCFLIDDDVDDQEIFLAILRDMGPSIRCITANNGHEAIQKLASQEVKPDIIFVDLNMPLMNGKQFLREYIARATLSEIPVIVLTTSSDKKSIEEMLDLGASDYITKPDTFTLWDSVIKGKINAFRRRQLM